MSLSNTTILKNVGDGPHPELEQLFPQLIPKSMTIHKLTIK
jgi:hypothetical protein